MGQEVLGFDVYVEEVEEVVVGSGLVGERTTKPAHGAVRVGVVAVVAAKAIAYPAAVDGDRANRNGVGVGVSAGLVVTVAGDRAAVGAGRRFAVGAATADGGVGCGSGAFVAAGVVVE